MAKEKPPQVYRLKITLKDIEPTVWRRVEVADCSLYELHHVIQRIMEWDGSHLWLFTIRDERYGDPSMDDDQDASEFQLSEFVKKRVKKFTYWYDFGDDWMHIIEVEKPVDADPLARYPRCVGGERAGPPEDCGGPWGYGGFVAALRDPHHARHDEIKEWFDGPYDPEAFDLDAINERFAPPKPKRKK